MRFLWFEVQGYKNLRAPLRLTDIGRINVLHGDNNVGKSNLLEAIGLFFVLVKAFREDARGGPSLGERYALRTPPTTTEAAGTAARTTVRSLSYFAEHGFPSNEIFNFKQKQPIELRACLEFEALDGDDDDPTGVAAPIEIGFQLEQRDQDLRLSLARLVRSDGSDISLSAEHTERVLARIGVRLRDGATYPRFALVRTDRTIVTALTPTADASGSREPLPRELGLAVYDAEEAKDPRFARLLTSLEAIRDLVGEGQWRAHYDRRADRADLRFDGEPLRLMGSGVQQIVNLAARLLLIACAVVHHEKVFHLKRQFGEKFNPHIIVKALKSRGWQIDPYEIRHALATGEWIGNRYPTESAWHLAKKERSLRSLGLDPSKVEVEGTGRSCGATVDWLIIGHARAEGCVLVSDDMGPEFAGLVERVKLATLETALQKLMSESS